MPDNCTSLIHPLQGLFSPEKRRLKTNQRNTNTEDSERRYPQPRKLQSDGFQVSLMEGIFLILRAIIKVKSYLEGGCGTSFPGGLTNRSSSQHRDDFPVLPSGRRKKEKFFLDSFQLCSGSSPGLKKHQF